MLPGQMLPVKPVSMMDGLFFHRICFLKGFCGVLPENI